MERGFTNGNFHKLYRWTSQEDPLTPLNTTRSRRLCWRSRPDSINLMRDFRNPSQRDRI